MRMSRNQIRPAAAAPPPKSSGDIGLPPKLISTATGSSGPSSAGEPPPKSPSFHSKSDDDDDDFLKTIVAAAGPSVATGATQTKQRQGLVLARDADGFERLMDARHVAEDAIVVRTGEEVQCPGCKDWFPEEKPSCPTCFRENWQGTGGRKKRNRRNLVQSCMVFGVLVCGGLIYVLSSLNFELNVPLEFKIFLWVALPFAVAGLIKLLQYRAAM